MRRVMSIAAFALFLSIPLWAQHGGGHAGGFAGHAGFRGGHVSSGMRSGVSRGFAHSSNRTFSRGQFLHKGFHRDFRGRGFRDGRFGYGYPWWNAGYYDPFLWDWWDSGSSYDEDYERDRAIANEMNQQSLEEQRMLRQEEADGDQDVYARRPARSRSNSGPVDEQSSAAPIWPTVLIFRDRHQEEVHNYAIVGQTLWNFAPQHTEKIPLADLDVVATVKANDDRGLTFHVPMQNEAQ